MIQVNLSEYDPAWPQTFESEKGRLFAALVHHAFAIDHIGSTSVPGLAAKAVIDIQVQVVDLATFDQQGGVERIEALGYRHHPEYLEMLPFRRLFSLRDQRNLLDVNIHLVEATHPWAARHLLFRDYLRQNLAARQRYEDIKKQLALKDWESVNHYAEAKSEIVLSIEEEAMEVTQLPSGVRDWLRSSRI